MELRDQLKNYADKHKSAIWIFLLTFLAGFLIHYYMFTNKFLNYFEMNNILTPMSMDKSDTVAQGKWFIPAFSSISTVYSMPAVNGIIGLCFLSLATVFICDILSIRSRLYGVLAGIGIMTFPSVASFFAYGVNTDVLCGSVWMAVFAVWCLEKCSNKKIGVVLSAILLGCTIGGYQPMFAISIAVVFSLLFLETVLKGIGFKELVKKTLRYAAVLAIGFLVYFLILQVILKVMGITLGDYHGVNEMTTFTLKGIAKGFVYTYIYFLRYFFTMEYCNYWPVLAANVLLTALFIGVVIYNVKKNRGKSGKGNTAGVLLLLCLLPIGTNAAPFLMADRVGNGVDRYMMFSIQLVYVLVLKLLSSTKWSEVMMSLRLRMGVQWLLFLSLLGVSAGGYYMCNQAYYRMEAMTTQENALFTRIVYRMESTEGWNTDIPVYLANCSNLFNENYEVEIPEFDTLNRMDGTELKPWYNRIAVAKYMKVYLHFPVNSIADEEIEAIEATTQYKQMGIYPARDCVQIIDGVMVVKFNEEAE